MGPRVTRKKRKSAHHLGALSETDTRTRQALRIAAVGLALVVVYQLTAMQLAPILSH